MAQAPKQRPDDEVAATRRKLARLLAIGALRAIAADPRKKPEDSASKKD